MEKTSCFLIFKDTKVGCLPGSVGECVISNGEFEPFPGCRDCLNKYLHLKKKKKIQSHLGPLEGMGSIRLAVEGDVRVEL